MQKIKSRTRAWFAAPGYEPITPADPHQTNLVPNSELRCSSNRIEPSNVSAANRMPICGPENPCERNRDNGMPEMSGLFGESMRA